MFAEFDKKYIGLELQTTPLTNLFRLQSNVHCRSPNTNSGLQCQSQSLSMLIMTSALKGLSAVLQCHTIPTLATH